MNLSEFSAIVGGVLTGPDAEFRGFSLDSRDITPGSLFLAIKGRRSDGHDHVESAIKSGAVASMVERPVPGPHVLVSDLVTGLASYARNFRDQFQGPVLAITGSNGKTATKEFAAAACAPLGPVLKSPSNHNTEYTAPLVWGSLTPETRAVVVEMGMRGLGQISHLCRFAQPTIGVVTMIGTAHVQMVGSREGIAAAKAELLECLPETGTAIIWSEDDFVGFLRERSAAPVRTFGFTPDSECQVLGYRPIDWTQCVVRGRLDGVSFEAELPTVGRHQALNAAAAILAAHSAGVGVEEAAKALGSAVLPPLRMEVRDLGGITILLDTYNASPDSTVAAIKTLAELPATGRKYAILGEMRELGDFSESGHRQVGRAAGEAPLEGLLLLGEETRFVQSEAVRAGLEPGRIRVLSGREEITGFLKTLVSGDLVLMKGSRALEMETAIPREAGAGA